MKNLRIELYGKIRLNEQDPYEPTGIVVKDVFNEYDLAELINQYFGEEPTWKDTFSKDSYKIIIEKIKNDN